MALQDTATQTNGSRRACPSTPQTSINTTDTNPAQHLPSCQHRCGLSWFCRSSGRVKQSTRSKHTAAHPTCPKARARLRPKSATLAIMPSGSWGSAGDRHTHSAQRTATCQPFNHQTKPQLQHACVSDRIVINMGPTTASTVAVALRNYSCVLTCASCSSQPQQKRTHLSEAARSHTAQGQSSSGNTDGRTHQVCVTDGQSFQHKALLKQRAQLVLAVGAVGQTPS